jgi:catechol 2,3-dioxygenase-like lactoylglutathione lyase family enzyme
MICSVFPVVCCSDLNACRDFYRELLGLEVVFESGWYTALASTSDRSHQLAFVLQDHQSVPSPYGRPAAGVLVTVEVDDVDAIHERSSRLGLDVVLSLRDEAFGQRHFMVRDPNGILLDVVQPIPASPSFLREVVLWRRGR